MKRSLLLALTYLCAHMAMGQTQIPSSISYQARVADSNGTPIGDTAPVNRTVILRVYGSPTGVDVLYAEQQTVTISKGHFSVLLGTGLQVGSEPRPAIVDALNGAERFLGITVDDGTPTADPEVSPRQQIVSTAFALRARQAENSARTDFAVTAATAQHVQAAANDTSNFNWINANNLTVDGHSKITGGNILEFGVGNTKQTAGEIGYQRYSDGLDIVGAGPTDAERRITMWADAGTTFRGPIFWNILNGGLGQHINLWGNSFGMGVQNNTLYQRSPANYAWYRGGAHHNDGFNGGGGSLLAYMDGNGFTVNSGNLTVNNGAINGVIDRFGHGIWAQSFGAGHSVGSQDWTTWSRSARSFAWYLGGGYNSSELNPGGGGTTLALLDNTGLRIMGPNNGAGQEGNAGKICYKTFTDGLDIIGAGTPNNRKIYMHTEGGMEVRGNLNGTGAITANGDLRSNNGWAYANRFAMKNNNGNYRWLIKGEADFDIDFDGTTRYRIDGNGNTFKLSDRNLKRDFQSMEATLPKLMKLKPTTYHFKTDDKNKPLSFGFVAQDVQEVFPQLVTTMQGNTIGLNYEGLIPVAIAAIQEQQKQIEGKDAEIATLKKRLAEAEGMNEKQDTRLAAIEKALKLETKVQAAKTAAVPVSTRR
jgi:hypothetical protein